MTFANPARTRRRLMMAAASNFLAGLISATHHWYGAVAYDTPWRAGVSYWIIGIVLFFCFLLYIYWVCIEEVVRKIVLWAFFFGAVLFQAGFTLFECVYSHVLKNILYFGGVPLSVMESLFPAPAYHLPDNLLFEITGLLQLAGFLAVWFSYRVFQDRPWAN